MFLNFSLLKKNKNFRFLFLGQLLSFFGTMISQVAFPYQIYLQTHSNLMVGLLSLAQLIPLLGTALFGGVLADRCHRRALLLIAEALLAVSCGLLLWNACLATPHIWVLFVVGSAMSALNGLHRPALQGILQQIIPAADFISASALQSLVYSLGMIAGPAVGGLLIAHFGLPANYAVDCATFIISLCALLQLRSIAAPPAVVNESILQALKQGLNYAFTRQELLGSYAVDIVAMIFGMPLALFPAIAMLHGGAPALGFLYAAPAVGAVLASLVSGWCHQVKRYGAAIGVAAILWGIAILLFGLCHHYFYLALFFLMLAGCFDAISGVFRSTLWNEMIAPEFRGRLAGIEMISYLSGPKLGDVEAGLMAAAFGVTASIVSGGVLCVLAVGVCCVGLPKFWRYRSATPSVME